jgi:hypothetical protein
MKQPVIKIVATTAIAAGCVGRILAGGLPEPGLVVYGAVRNTANSNGQIISGTLTWTITPASSSPVTVTTPLTDITGHYSSGLLVPFESVVENVTSTRPEPGDAFGVWGFAGKGADTAFPSPTESLRHSLFALKSCTSL